MLAWGRCVVGVRSLLLLLLLAGCETIAGGPDRLYKVNEEVAQAQLTLPILIDNYSRATLDGDRKAIRNEYVARRMYIIDVEYSAYEAGLTRDKQVFSFGADTTAQVLNVIGAATTSGATSRVLNGVAGGVSAVNGYYDKDLIVAKTIQVVEGQMRAQRDIIAKTILDRRNESASTYTLSDALSLLESYYLAGTFNTGLLQATTDAGNASRTAQDQKIAAMNAAITNVRTPLPLLTPMILNPSGLTDTERYALTPTDITQIQNALCVPNATNSFGDLNSPPRQALSAFFTAYGLTHGNPQEIDSTKKLAALSRATAFIGSSGGSCAAAKLQTAQDVASAVKPK